MPKPVLDQPGKARRSYVISAWEDSFTENSLPDSLGFNFKAGTLAKALKTNERSARKQGKPKKDAESSNSTSLKEERGKHQKCRRFF